SIISLRGYSSLNKRALAAACYIAGVTVALALPARAQNAEPAQPLAADPSMPLVTNDPPSNPDGAADRNAAGPGPQMLQAFIAKLDKATRAMHESAKKGPAEVREGCRAFLNEFLDLDAMTEATNAEIWSQMTPRQRESFRTAFERRMITTCVRQF